MNTVVFGTRRIARRFSRQLHTVLDDLPKKEPLKLKKKMYTLEEKYNFLFDQYFVENRCENQTKNWSELTEQILTENRLNLTDKNLPTLLLTYFKFNCDFSSAESFMEHLTLKGRPNNSSLATFMSISAMANQEQPILESFAQMDSESLLDVRTRSQVVHSLSETREWRKALEIITKYNYEVTPGCWGRVGKAAFRAGDRETGIRLLKEVAATKCSQSLFDAAVTEWVATLRQQPVKEELEVLMRTLRDTELLLPFKAVGSLKESIERISDLQGKTITIPKSICPECGHHLEEINITHSEFQLLRSETLSFLDAKDVYLNTDPTEMTRFLTFLRSSKPYDVVIDGLNLTYSGGHLDKRTRANTLLKVVQTFRNEGKKVLVIGRHHMRHLTRNFYQDLTQVAQSFLTKDTSNDDIFLLVSSVWNGPETLLVSVDLMRNHAFKFTPEVKRIFLRWLQTHQMYMSYVQFGEKVIKMDPRLLDTRVQGSWEEGFHVPHAVEESKANGPYDYPKEWICFRSKHKKYLIK